MIEPYHLTSNLLINFGSDTGRRLAFPGVQTTQRVHLYRSIYRLTNTRLTELLFY